MLKEGVSEDFRAYKVLKHQHTPEIDQILSSLSGSEVAVSFVAHLLPIFGGILETIYVQLKEGLKEDQIYKIYKKFYKTEHFVRILEQGQQPKLKDVIGTNYCDVSIAFDEEKNLLIITTAIDNLIKGAAGQAVQNLNIMCGFKETEGLK